jgi:hypothetical protein
MTFFQTSGVEDWCSTSNPQGSCKPLSGVCKPMNTSALVNFKELQNQLNRIAVAKGWSKVDVDGRIGGATVALWNKASELSVWMSPESGCDGLADLAASGAAASQARTAANNLNAPAVVSAPITSRPSSPNADPSKPPSDPPALAITDTLFGMVSSPFGLVIAAGLGYAAYRLAKGGKSPAASSPRPGRPKRARARRPSRARPTRRPSRGRRRRSRR